MDIYTEVAKLAKKWGIADEDALRRAVEWEQDDRLAEDKRDHLARRLGRKRVSHEAALTFALEQVESVLREPHLVTRLTYERAAELVLRYRPGVVLATFLARGRRSRRRK